MTKPSAAPRSAYPHFLTIPTRWMDNDVYGHVNNVVYYSYFDTVVNEYLIRAGVLDFEAGATIGLVVETQCNYFSSLVFPERVEAGLRVARLGSTSVRYELGLFKEGNDEACAQGYFVHVYVDRLTRRPVALPDALRAALEPLAVSPGSKGDTDDARGAKLA
ncbi:MAG TPA: thioesterase family protein [Trinickia sp.]|nr:thioesterase family protein [Trinickia sp.]